MGIFDEIPDDPELAFLQLEEKFRTECVRAMREADRNYDPVEDQIRYISRTLAAKTELDIDALSDWTLPNARDLDDQVYQDFRRDVDHYRTILEIRHSRRNKGLTVRFDAIAKSKLRHYVTQIKDFVDRLELDDWKRDNLFKAINAFELEIDRDRSRLGIYGNLVVACGGILGETAEKAEPVRKWIDSISGLIWGAEMQERNTRLPAFESRRELPAPPKKIAPPKKGSGKGRSAQADDEIPF